MHRPFRPLVCLIAALCLLNLAAQAQDLYVITLDRVRAVGQEFKSTLTMEQELAIQVFDGETLAKTEKTISKKTLTGIAKVLRVDETGNITALTYKIEECTREDNGTAKTLLRSGQLLAMFNNPEGVTFTVDGFPVADEVLHDSLMDLLKPDNTARLDRVDAKIGVDHPVKVGESWAIAPDFLETLLATDGMVVAREKVKVRSKLVGVGELGGEAATNVDMTAIVDLSGSVQGGLPVNKGAMKIQVVYVQPIASDNPSQRFRLQVQNNTLVVIPPNEEMPAGRKVTAKLKISVQDDMALIKPEAEAAE